MRWLAVGLSCLLLAASAQEVQLTTDFSAPGDAVLRAHGSDHPPLVSEGGLQLLTGQKGENNSAAWPVVAPGSYRRIEAELSFRLDPAAHGFSLMLLHSNHFHSSGPAFELYKPMPLPGHPKPAAPHWDEPNLWGSFALAVDTHNPPTDDPFDAAGNVHKRPQREISLHYDGKELANAFCEPMLTGADSVKLQLTIEFVTGGAEVSVDVDGHAVYERHFLPHLLPYEARVALGAWGADGGTLRIDSLRVHWLRPAAESPPALTVEVVRRGGTRPAGEHAQSSYELLPEGIELERVLLHYRLNPLVKRDEWDRLGWLYVWDGDARYELALILTPFRMWGAVYEYVIDVTDFAWLLQGRRKLDFGPRRGFVTDVSFTAYRRPADVEPLPRVVGMANVWNGAAHFNNPASVEATFGVRRIPVPAEARGAKLRICVTGHGGTAEFKPLQRTVRVGGQSFEDTLWTTDCYLNPWRPQFGTWKYDRAGWGPGSAGRIWEIDLSALIEPGSELELEYIPETIESSSWDNHHVESQLVFYGG